MTLETQPFGDRDRLMQVDHGASRFALVALGTRTHAESRQAAPHGCAELLLEDDELAPNLALCPAQACALRAVPPREHALHGRAVAYCVTRLVVVEPHRGEGDRDVGDERRDVILDEVDAGPVRTRHLRVGEDTRDELAHDALELREKRIADALQDRGKLLRPPGPLLGRVAPIVRAGSRTMPPK